MDSILLVAQLGDRTVLLIEDDRENTSGVFLFERRADGSQFDTWHRTIEDAKEQATYQFGLPPEAWLGVSAVTDPLLLAEIRLVTLPDSN